MPCGLNLIVTAPQSKTRMMPDSAHIIFRLAGNIFHEIIVHIIDIACKKQILPYDQSVAVTKIKECIRREETTSPYTNTIEICTHTGFQNIINFLCRNIWVDRIIRNIISAPCKNLHTINFKTEFAAPLILILTDGKCTQSNCLYNGISPLCIGCFLIRKSHRQLIQILLTISIWPPEFRLLYYNLCCQNTIGTVCCMCNCFDFSLFFLSCSIFYNTIAKFPQCHNHILRQDIRHISTCIFQTNLCAHLHTAIRLMFLINMYIRNTLLRISFQINIPENARIYELWTPVPAKHGMCFPHQFIAFHCTRRHIVDLTIFTEFIIFDIFQHREKTNLYCILSLFQILLNGKTIGSMHV